MEQVLSAVVVIAFVSQSTANVLADQASVGTGSKENAGPCSNFHKYVCYGRSNASAVAEEEMAARKHSELDVNSFLEDYRLQHTITDAEKKFYDFKKHCTGAPIAELKEFLRTFNFPNTTGGWPAVDPNWKSDKFDLQAAFAEMHSYSIMPFFDMELKYNFKLLQNELRIIRWPDSFDRDTLSNKIDNINEVIRDSEKIENMSLSEQVAADDDIIMDVKTLKKDFSEIDWDKQFAALFGQELSDSFPVRIVWPKSLKRFIQRLVQVNPRTLANYLFYKFATSSVIMDESYIHRLFQPVWYPMVTKYYYSGENLKEIKNMLHVSIKTLFEPMDLVGDQDKIDAEIDQFIDTEVIPDVDDTYINRLYENIEITPTNCYSNAMDLKKIREKEMNKFDVKGGTFPVLDLGKSLRWILANHFPKFSRKQLAYRFKALFWPLLDTQMYFMRDPDFFKKVAQCFKAQIAQGIYLEDIRNLFGVQILVRAYFRWAKLNPELVEREETSLRVNNKVTLLRVLMKQFCNTEEKTANAYFSNLKEFKEVFNCQADTSEKCGIK